MENPIGGRESSRWAVASALLRFHLMLSTSALPGKTWEKSNLRISQVRTPTGGGRGYGNGSDVPVSVGQSVIEAEHQL